MRLLKNMDVLCYMHCFMFASEYWGVTYLGEIDKQDVPTDLDEVIGTAMFADVPNNVRRDFEGQAKALHSAALNYLTNNKSNPM